MQIFATYQAETIQSFMKISKSWIGEGVFWLSNFAYKNRRMNDNICLTLAEKSTMFTANRRDRFDKGLKNTTKVLIQKKTETELRAKAMSHPENEQ